MSLTGDGADNQEKLEKDAWEGARGPTSRKPFSTWLSGGSAIVAAGGRLLDANESLLFWLMLTRETAIGSPFWDLFRSVSIWAETVQDLAEGTESFAERELAPAVPEGSWVAVALARHEGAQFIRIVSILPPGVALENDSQVTPDAADETTGQLRLRLFQAEAQIENLMDRWPGVIFSQRPDFSFRYASTRLEDLSGVPVEQWRRRPGLFWELIHEADAPELQQHIRQASRNGQSVTTQFRLRHALTGRVSYLLEHRHPILTTGGLLLGFEGVWLDISRQTIAERRLSTAAWRDTLAVLTMGLAHDFGNILAGIFALAETMESSATTDEFFGESIALIKRNAMQASHLIRRILNLHQGKPGEYAYYGLNTLVGEILELVRKIIPRRIQVETELTAEDLPVYVDAVELRQVFLNLVMNAVDAMPHSGHLRLTTSRLSCPPENGHMQGHLPNPPYVVLSVRDTGIGIPKRNLSNIFDPFFTTKPVNKGSGLGLYNARLFVEKHRGAISVESEEGSGTTFSLWLPQADFTENERLGETPGLKRRTLMLHGYPGGPLDKMAEFLRRSGYFIVTEDSEERAMAMLDSPDYEFAAVIVQAGSDPVTGFNLLNEVRNRKLPMKRVIQIAGRNQDELDNRLLRQADAVLSPDIPEREILDRLSQLFDVGGLER
jgi:signal transduction histidine kinase